jgi:transcriptional regulator with XRE-family HTH domain
MRTIASGTERLQAWMKKKKKNQAEAAEALCITQGFLSRVLRGEKRFSDETAARVEKITRGEVSFLELKHPRYRKTANG